MQNLGKIKFEILTLANRTESHETQWCGCDKGLLCLDKYVMNKHTPKHILFMFAMDIYVRTLDSTNTNHGIIAQTIWKYVYKK